MTKNKGFTLIELLVVIAIIGTVAAIIISSIHKAEAGWFSSTPTPKTETQTAREIQKKLIQDVPVPQLEHSLERENVSKRAQIFNTPDKISYIYLVSYGKVMAFYTVKGKVSSLQSYMVPTEKMVRSDGSSCGSSSSSEYCFTISAPDIDGTYGENVQGIFFFTTDGAYVEWKGDYMMSDQPLKLTTQPELVRTIK